MDDFSEIQKWAKQHVQRGGKLTLTLIGRRWNVGFEAARMILDRLEPNKEKPQREALKEWQKKQF